MIWRTSVPLKDGHPTNHRFRHTHHHPLKFQPHFPQKIVTLCNEFRHVLESQMLVFLKRKFKQCFENRVKCRIGSRKIILPLEIKQRYHQESLFQL